MYHHQHTMSTQEALRWIILVSELLQIPLKNKAWGHGDRLSTSGPVEENTDISPGMGTKKGGDM